jgi:hypothetical protein
LTLQDPSWVSREGEERLLSVVTEIWKVSRIIEGRTARWLLGVSPFGAGAATFAGLFTYLPDSLFAPDGTQLGRYAIALAGAFAAGFGIELTIHSAEAARRIPLAQNDPTYWFRIQRQTNQALIETKQPFVHGFGWPHYLTTSQPRTGTPTALASAYGIKIAALCGNEPATIEWDPVVSSILSEQVAGGGWAGRTHGLKPRPEITATVVSALAVAGVARAILEPPLSRLQSLCSDKADIALWQRTYLLASSLSDLLTVPSNDSSDSAVSKPLAETLMRGAIICEQSEVAWGELIGAPTPRPSTVHTARALVALHKYRDSERSESFPVDQLVEHGTRWLRKHAHLDYKIEHLNRFYDSESSTIRHFTAAWVVRALAFSGLDATDPTMNRALQVMMSDFNRGLWRWNEAEAPIWMTYQSLRALHSLATVPVL